MKSIWASVVLLLLSHHARGDGCDAILAAQNKDPGVPVRSTLTLAMNGMAFTTVTISANGKSYTQLKDGSWKVEDQVKPTDMKKRNDYWLKQVCSSGETESIDGDAADVVIDHDSDIPSDTRFWISKTLGVILKTETTYRNGSKITAVYEYKNVQPPDMNPAPAPHP